MSTPSAYFDHAASTPLDPRAFEAMRPWLTERFGNPSSRHRAGVAAAAAIDAARGVLARAVGAQRTEIVFTSGGTEANNLGVLGAARVRRRHGTHVLVGPTEHSCVRDAARALAEEGFEVEAMALDASGELDLERASSQVRPDTIVVAGMLVQNEVGTIYPIRELTRRVRARAKHASVHVDAVQALGKIEVSFVELGCDTLAFSAHKLHGPHGVGALVVRAGHALRPLVFGGGQERGLRSGTENVAGIVGFGCAAKLAEDELASSRARIARWSERIVADLEALPGARVLGHDRAQAVPHIVAVVWPGVPSEVRMHHLEQLGIVVSAGSACQSKKNEISPSLAALGLSAEEARTMMRISLSRATSDGDVDRLLEALADVARKFAPARA